MTQFSFLAELSFFRAHNPLLELWDFFLLCSEQNVFCLLQRVQRKAIPGNVNKFRNHVVLSLNMSLTFRWGHFSRSVWWSGCNVCLGGLVCVRQKEMGEWHSFLIKWEHWVWKMPLTHVSLISCFFFFCLSFFQSFWAEQLLSQFLWLLCPHPDHALLRLMALFLYYGLCWWLCSLTLLCGVKWGHIDGHHWSFHRHVVAAYS